MGPTRRFAATVRTLQWGHILLELALLVTGILYVDRLYMTYLLDQGLVAPRRTRLPSIALSDSTFADRVGITPRVEDDPLWRLPQDAPQLYVLANRVWYRGTVSQNALGQTRQVVAEIGEVRQAIERELAVRRWP